MVERAFWRLVSVLFWARTAWFRSMCVFFLYNNRRVLTMPIYIRDCHLTYVRGLLDRTRSDEHYLQSSSNIVKTIKQGLRDKRKRKKNKKSKSRNETVFMVSDSDLEYNWIGCFVAKTYKCGAQVQLVYTMWTWINVNGLQRFGRRVYIVLAVCFYNIWKQQTTSK